MTIYSIGDLHLSSGDKPMDVFGPHWTDHFARISADWRARVQAEDIVLIPGDISWAMRLQDAQENLLAIGELPGRKVMIRGNHDYWWSSISRVRAMLPKDFYAIQNDCLLLGDVMIAGTRGWILPGDGVDASDEKIYERELMRLTMSLSAARRISDSLPLICMLHYPPRTDKIHDTGFTQRAEHYRCDHVVYGHLHGAALKNAFHGIYNGVFYHQVSCDRLNFRLHEVAGEECGEVSPEN